MDVDYLLTMCHQDGDHEVLHNASVYRESEGRCSMSFATACGVPQFPVL
jgi:hypothetical protein